MAYGEGGIRRDFNRHVEAKRHERLIVISGRLRLELNVEVVDKRTGFWVGVLLLYVSGKVLVGVFRVEIELLEDLRERRDVCDRRVDFFDLLRQYVGPPGDQRLVVE